MGAIVAREGYRVAALRLVPAGTGLSPVGKRQKVLGLLLRADTPVMVIHRVSLGFLAAIGLAAGCASLPCEEGRPTSDATMPDVAVVDVGVVICELSGRDSIVRVLAWDAGTRYTLCDVEGSVIAANLDGPGLAALRPDLDPRRLQADGGFELMMVDHAE